MKIVPQLYNYLKLSGASSLLKTRNLPINKNVSLTYDAARMNSLNHSGEEINKAYRTYAQSSYINDYLRSGEPLSIENNELVSALRQAINTSQPVSGTFVRGLTFSRKTPLNDENIFKYIFNNAGFTSTAPKENARFAETFALGKNSAVVEFDIKEPIKAFRASNWEVLFDINAFVPEKFGIKKIKDGLYRVFQK